MPRDELGGVLVTQAIEFMSHLFNAARRSSKVTSLAQ